MKNINNKNKRILSLLLAFVMIMCIMPVSTLIQSFAETPKYDDTEFSVELEGSYGTDYIFSNRSMSFYVRIKNKTGHDISGTINISANKMYMLSGGILYQKEFILPANVEKRIEMPILFENVDFISGITCTVTNKKGKLLCNSVSKTLNNQSMDSYLVGLVSDDVTTKNYSSLKYATSIYGQSFLTLDLTPEYFPSNSMMMSEFGMIIIDSVDTSKSSLFSQEQLNLLDEYIKGGGVVLVSTGANAQQGLEPVKKYFAGNISDSCRFLGNEDVNWEFNDSNYISILSETKFSDKYSLCSINDDNFQIVSGSENFNIQKHKDYNLYVTTFSIKNDPALFTYILTSIAKDDGSAECLLNTGKTSKEYYFRSITKDVMDRTPKGLAVFVILTIYAVAMLVIFIIFNKKRKELLLWILLPGLAVVFSVVFYLYGMTLHGNEMSNLVKIAELNASGYGNSAIISASYVQNGGDCKISYGIEDAIYYEYSDDEESGVASYDNPPSYSRSGIIDGSNITAKAYVNEHNYVGLNSKIEYDSGSGEYILTVTNGTGRDLTDTYAIIGNSVVLIGDLPAGQKIEKKGTVKNIYNSSTTAIDNAIYEYCYKKAGYSLFEASQDMKYLDNDSEACKSILKNKPELFQKAQKMYNLSSYVLKTISKSISAKCALICYDANDKVDVSVNDKKLRRNYSDTFIYQPITVEFEEGYQFYIKKDVMIEEQISSVERNDQGDLVYSYAETVRDTAFAYYPIYFSQQELDVMKTITITVPWTNYGEMLPNFSYYDNYNSHFKDFSSYTEQPDQLSVTVPLGEIKDSLMYIDNYYGYLYFYNNMDPIYSSKDLVITPDQKGGCCLIVALEFSRKYYGENSVEVPKYLTVEIR